MNDRQGMTYARNKALGSYGEGVAARHLTDAGMVVLERNWTCRFGEIDIVARDGDTLVFVEVKTRSGTSHGTNLEAVTQAKAERLRTLAGAWLEGRAIRPPVTRIDVVAVQIPAKGPAEVRHVKAVA